MRDAFGGVFTMNLLIVFIFIYVAFSAVSLTYAKAFRLKNKVIDFVEQNEIISLEETYLSGKLAELDQILDDSKYNKTCESINSEDGEIESESGTSVIGYCYRGILIEKIEDESQTIEGTSAEIIRYQISTYATWNLGALNKILALGGKSQNSEDYIYGSWKVTGEATVVSK